MRRFKSAGHPSAHAPSEGLGESAGEYRGQKGSEKTGDNPAGNSGDKVVEAAAVRLLARREHSVEELSRKLQSKGHSAAVVETVVAKLRDKKLVSDDRYSSSLVRHRAQRGQGPIRIRAELRQQGITDEAIEAQMKAPDLDWNAIAAAARQRKFGANLPRSMPERAKQTRFLQYRGFSSDQIRAALKSDEESYGSDMEADAGLDLDLDS